MSSLDFLQQWFGFVVQKCISGEETQRQDGVVVKRKRSKFNDANDLFSIEHDYDLRMTKSSDFYVDVLKLE